MFQDMFKVSWLRLKQALQTMPVHKFGITVRIVSNAIYGRSVASYMRCAASNLLSAAKIWMSCIKKYNQASMTKYRRDIRLCWKKPLVNAWKNSRNELN